MKKIYNIIVLFAIVFVIAAGSVSAEIDLSYPGGASATAPVGAGTDVNYNYWIDDTYSTGAPVQATISLLDSSFTPLTTLVNVNSNGYYFASEIVDTTTLPLGTYYIFGEATDAAGSYTDYLSFDVIAPTNTAPYFPGMSSYYSYPLNMMNVNVVDLSAYGFDAENDPMTYSMATSTNPSVATCSLIGATVNCDLWAIGTTTVDVTVSDGVLSTVQTLTIEVTPAVNLAPQFNSTFPLSYVFPEVPSNADVVDLALYSYDPNNDPITYWVDTSATNTAVISQCNIVSGSVLNCDWAGVGITTVDVKLFDGSLITTQTITIEVTPAVNNVPYFVNMTQFYMYHVSTGSATVVDLAAYGFDADNDPLTYSMSTSSNPSIASCTMTGTVIDCAFPGSLGVSQFDVTVSDGMDSSVVTIYINVYDYIGNNTAPIFMNMAHFYMYDINTASSATIDINHGFDAENDPLSYYLDTGFTNPSVLSCSLASTDVNCNFNGLGLTTFDAIVSDGVLSSVDTVYVLVYDSNANNNAPYFDNMNSFYSYPLLMGATNVVDLSAHGADLDSDPLTYYLDTGFTSPYVLDASLVSGNVVHADLLDLGTTTVRAIVYDGQWASEQTLTIEVTDSSVIGPMAIIDAPSSVCPGAEFEVDGTGSYTVPSESIVDYTWVITDNLGNPLVSSTGAVSMYTITTPGDYYISLQVVDSAGDSAFAIVPLEVSNSACGGNFGLGTEEGLKIRSFTVDGFDFEKAYSGEDLVIWAEVENVADVDFEGIRMIYTLPEFGIRMKSNAFNLESGERDVVQILGFVPDYVEEGVYYPYIEFSDNEFRRVKVGYLEVYEQ